MERALSSPSHPYHVTTITGAMPEKVVASELGAGLRTLSLRHEQICKQRLQRIRWAKNSFCPMTRNFRRVMVKELRGKSTSRPAAKRPRELEVRIQVCRVRVQVHNT